MLRILLLLLALVAGTMGPAAAVEESELLPVDEAFRLEARAPSRNRIEFHWTIAPGYYMYRERIAAQPVDSAFKFNPLELPPGEKKHDEFFGDVETYRDEVTAEKQRSTPQDLPAGGKKSEWTQERRALAGT